MKYDFCLCCLKKLNDEEKKTGYHRKCIKKFFGTTQIPQVELSNEILELLAKKSSSQGIAVAGVQKKLSLHLLSQKNSSPRLTLLGYPQGYILKPQSADYEYLPETEGIVMQMADLAGIETVHHSLILLSDNSLAYITKRIDRDQNAEKIHMEDFCQISERLTEDKYKGSYEQCAKIIQKFSSFPGLDLSDFFYRLLFCFITGNSDMHLKNFSLIKNPESKEWKLSKAYDLLPVNLLMPLDNEETALTLNGKKAKLKRTDFLEFASSIKIPQNAADKMISNLLSKKEKILALAACSLISEEMQNRFINLIEERYSRLM